MHYSRPMGARRPTGSPQPEPDRCREDPASHHTPRPPPLCRQSSAHSRRPTRRHRPRLRAEATAAPGEAPDTSLALSATAPGRAQHRSRQGETPVTLTARALHSGLPCPRFLGHGTSPSASQQQPLCQLCRHSPCSCEAQSNLEGVNIDPLFRRGKDKPSKALRPSPRPRNSIFGGGEGIRRFGKIKNPYTPVANAILRISLGVYSQTSYCTHGCISLYCIVT